MSESPVNTEVPSTKRWYVVHAYSGMEKAGERNLRERIDRSGMSGKFGRILVPTEEVVELKNGKKAVTERRFFPGYVLVEMDMDDESLHLVKHTNKVTGFVGGKVEDSLMMEEILAVEILVIQETMEVLEEETIMTKMEILEMFETLNPKNRNLKTSLKHNPK